MRAAVYHRFGGPEVLHIQDVPMPAVGHDDVLIQVYASTVSAADHRACALDVPAGVWLPRRTGHPVATTPGPYRAKDLAYPVELADTGHYQPVTQTTVDLDDIAAAHRLADTGRKRGNVVVRIPHTHPEGHRS